MVFEGYSELIFNIAYWLGLSVAVLVVSLMAFVLLLRMKLMWKQRRHQRFVAKWEVILNDWIRLAPNKLPPISRIDHFSFFIVWNRVYDQLSADAETLKQLRNSVYLTGMDRKLSRMLRQQSIRKCLMAIVTLGHLREESEWDELCAIANSPHSLLSLVACHALMHINKERATPIFIGLIDRHKDWPTAKIASLLEQAGPDLTSQGLAELVANGEADDLPRLIHFLETSHSDIALAVVRETLQRPGDDNVIAPSLQVIARFKQQKDLELVRRYLDHPRWHVRAQAASCIGVMGEAVDEQRLLKLLSDQQWWVRYRSAQSLAKLPFISAQRLDEIQAQQQDQFSKDILNQVIAEKQLVTQ